MAVLKLVAKPLAADSAAPKHLSKAAKAEWTRLAPLLRAKGTLTSENEPLLTAYVNAMGLIAECDRELGKGKLLIKGANGVSRPHPLLGARNKASQNALQFAKRLGIIGDGTAPAQPSGGAGNADDAYTDLGI
jgi:P27 family predicted phage terminase small subunit